MLSYMQDAAELLEQLSWTGLHCAMTFTFPVVLCRSSVAQVTVYYLFSAKTAQQKSHKPHCIILYKEDQSNLQVCSPSGSLRRKRYSLVWFVRVWFIDKPLIYWHEVCKWNLQNIEQDYPSVKVLQKYYVKLQMENQHRSDLNKVLLASISIKVVELDKWISKFSTCWSHCLFLDCLDHLSAINI